MNCPKCGLPMGYAGMPGSNAKNRMLYCYSTDGPCCLKRQLAAQKEACEFLNMANNDLGDSLAEAEHARDSFRREVTIQREAALGLALGLASGYGWDSARMLAEVDQEVISATSFIDAKIANTLDYLDCVVPLKKATEEAK